ncbi:MAG: response regulator transcription factor [Chloroflexota bacterium]
MIRILLADDNPALRSALTLLLETRLHVHIVGESYNMESLLVSVAHTHPDIVILDWELPGVPKANRVAILREVYPSLKIVITSSQPEVAQQALVVHADAYISKSEPPEQMVQVLRTISPYTFKCNKHGAESVSVRR